MKKVRSTLVVTMGLLGWSGVCAAQSESDLCKDPCTVTVSLMQRGGGCVVTFSPVHKLRLSAKKAHRVVWTFQNNCGKEMNLGVGNFRHAPPSNVTPGTDKVVDTDPFDSRDPRHVKVGHGKSGELRAAVKTDALSTLSYKYDILDGKTELLDPEIEIRP